MSADGMTMELPNPARIAELQAEISSYAARFSHRGAYAWESAHLSDLQRELLREEMRGQPVVARPAPLPPPTRGPITMLERMFGRVSS